MGDNNNNNNDTTNDSVQDTQKPTTIINTGPKYDLESVMRVYYQRLFPFNLMYRWLSYGNTTKNYFQHREFSFTLQNDIYVRYNSFSDEAQFRSVIIKDNPIKIDIGAVYNAAPCDHKKGAISNFLPLEKELVFDIDMDPYNEVRTCCEKSNICGKCWVFIVGAIKVIDRALREDFGFEHILWVYSGRRGIHCWVADERAKKLLMDVRTSIVEYLTVIKGKKENRYSPTTIPLHPALSKAYTLLLPLFEERILEEQEVLTPARWDNVLSFIPGETQKTLRDRWNADGESTTAKTKWDQLKKTIEDAIAKKKMRFQNPIVDIVFYYTYPRLDIEVSKGVNHLLKSPFCVHPLTGRVCIPVDPLSCDDFDPLGVITVYDLIEELDRAPSDGKQKEYKRTSLRPSIVYFKEIFLKVLETSLRSKILQTKDDENLQKMDF
eukprot:TRINITY_DN2443_c0_g1_i1.p1 TRINITY_DN2443_c0_g1~~TRINITY_DN2443_c0_g1_i1.p1  ORF type:complete len:436 (+),score=90.89 TRINITY_DN2443_c0_g1_i1:218-1525(+)